MFRLVATPRDKLLSLMVDLLRSGRVKVDFRFPEEITGVRQYTDLDGSMILVVEDRCLLAAEAVRLGLSVDVASKLLGWREFERFVSAAFESHGYSVAHDYRFTVGGLRRQIDVVAAYGERVFCVDCKHWSKTRGLKAVCQSQVERCRLLTHTTTWREIYPIVVTLSFNGVIEGVPVVAAYALRDFLLNLDQYLDTLLVIRQP